MDLNRQEMLKELESTKLWDTLIIGGGATGLGSAVDSASRGYKTLLLEQSDFAKGTSSRSTKLIHGGLRYLKQGNLSLVHDALKERGLLCKNAPHLVSPLSFLVPSYHWWEGPFYGIGLHLYDLLAGDLGLEKSIHLNKEETLKRVPAIQTEGLKGANIYFDGQFDDARLALCLAMTARDLGATLLNYMEVVGFIKENDLIVGVEAVEKETNRTFLIRAKVVIQATGVFSDRLRKIDDKKSKPIIQPSQGVHIILDRSFWPVDTALLIPKTPDGRVLFFVPWHNHLLIGTTDTPVQEALLEPKPLSAEVDFLLDAAAHYLTKPPQKKDILSQFAGLRPLIKSEDETNTSTLSRDHQIFVSKSNLLTITGGKWTTYRKMAEDVIDQAIHHHFLPKNECKTAELKLHGYEATKHPLDAWYLYGSDRFELAQWIKENPAWDHFIHPKLPYKVVELIWGVRKEMARTVEDLLARRTRALFLDAKAAIEIAPFIASLLANELGKNQEWAKNQVLEFNQISKGYIP